MPSINADGVNIVIIAHMTSPYHTAKILFEVVVIPVSIIMAKTESLQKKNSTSGSDADAKYGVVADVKNANVCQGNEKSD